MHDVVREGNYGDQGNARSLDRTKTVFTDHGSGVLRFMHHKQQKWIQQEPGALAIDPQQRLRAVTMSSKYEHFTPRIRPAVHKKRARQPIRPTNVFRKRKKKKIKTGHPTDHLPHLHVPRDCAGAGNQPPRLCPLRLELERPPRLPFRFQLRKRNPPPPAAAAAPAFIKNTRS